MATNGKLKSLIQAGSDLVGAGIGGALGFAAGGPATAAGASAAGVVVSRVLGDMANRALSEREATRVGATAAIAAQIINARLEAGQKLRNDGFFGREGPGERSSAAEIFEGTLLAARNTHEEKKLKHLGILYSNVAFDGNCPASEANYQIKTAEALTYSQYVLLRLFGMLQSPVSVLPNPFNLRQGQYQPGEQLTFAALNLLQATYELATTANLVLMKLPGEAHSTIILGLNTIRPGHLTLTSGGLRLHGLLGLHSIPQEELESVAKWLR